MEHIDSSQIHLWLAVLDEITDPRLLNDYRLVLSSEELQRQQRFHFECDRHRYLVTRAMVRTVLSKYADVTPRHWRFKANSYGRPEIDNENPWARRLSFNVAHTSRLVLLGIALDRSLGVDVEDMSAGRACVDLADRFLAPQEVQGLHALPPEQQVRRFFEYWTLKESYIKARGMGLSIPLDRFAFHFDDASRIRLEIDSSLRDCAARWTFLQLQLPCGHMGAVCANGGSIVLPGSPRSWSR